MEKTKKKKMKDREMIKNDRYPKKKNILYYFACDYTNHRI